MAIKNIKFEDGHVVIDPPKKPKKITGTRFGAVLDANRWQTPFQAWCEITKAYVKPFEESIYQAAGKVIEEKQLTWFERLVKIVRPTDIYGEDPFNSTYGDFFSDNKIFGGMWDGLVGTPDDVTGVIECKTTKRAEDWENDVPEYYALQAALYARLLGVDDVYMIVTFLDPKDYADPEAFVCDASNTTYVHFKVSERYPNFQEYVNYCEQFWNENVMTGISPAYDEKADEEYLTPLRTNVIDDNDTISSLVAEAEALYAHVSEVEESIKSDKKRLSDIETLLKKYAIEHETEGQTKSEFKGNLMTWTVSKSVKSEINKKLMEADGILEKYTTETSSYTIRKAENKGE